jgi:hypothetical protein
MSADEHLIQETISRYHQAASLGDWATTVATFTGDGVWELLRSGRKLVGHDQILEALISFTASLDYVVQVNAPAIIKIDGDTATARSSIRESGKFADRAEGLEAFGIYHDQLIRTADGWKFVYRAFETRWLHRVPVLAPQVSPATA